MSKKRLEAIFESIARQLQTKNFKRFSQKKLLEPPLPESNKRDEILFEEAAFWLSLSPPFNQKDYPELIALSAQKRLEQEGFYVPVSQNLAQKAVRSFLKTHGIERKYLGYEVPPDLAVSIIFKSSEEDLKRRLDFLEEYSSLYCASWLAQILSFFVEKRLPERKLCLERVQKLFLEALEKGHIKGFSSKDLMLMAGEILKKGICQEFFVSPPKLFSVFKKHLGKDSKVSSTLEMALWALFLGQTEEALFWVEKTQKDWIFSFLEALCLYYQGNIGLALEKADLSLSLFRAGSKTKYPLKLGIWGVFLARILLAGGRSLRKEAIIYLKKLIKEEPLLSKTMLREYLKYLRHKGSEVFLSPRSPIDHLFCAWILEGKLQAFDEDSEDEFSEVFLESLRFFQEIYEREGLLFWAAEIARTLAVLGDQEARDWLEERGLLFKGSSSSPSWKRDLENLRQLLQEGNFGEEKRRLVWVLDFENQQITPLEQKRKKDGSWSKGRRVSLKRLFERDYDPISSEDERVLAYIKKEEYYGGYDYIFEPEVFLALVGHPRVFEAKTFTPLELVETLPEVILREEKKGLRLLVDPYVPSSSSTRIYLLREGTKIKVVRITPELRSLSDILGKKGLFFPKEAEGDLKEILSSLSEKFFLNSDLQPEEACEVPPERPLHLILRPAGEGLELTVRARPLGPKGPSFLPAEGPKRSTARLEGKLLTTLRDLKRERLLFEKLGKALENLKGLEAFEAAQWRAPDLETALNLLEVLERLPSEDYLLFWPEGRPFTVVSAPDDIPLTGKSLSDWLEVDTPAKILDGEVSFSEILRRFPKKPSRFIPITEKRFLALRENLYRRLRELAELAEIKGGQVRLHPLRAYLLAKEGICPFKGDREWEEFRQKLEKALSLKPDVPTGIKTRLRPYQEEGFVWLRRLYEAGLGGCLADDMGLGKTIQTLALLLSVAPNGPSLVVAPASVLSVWQEEIRRFAPALEVIPLGEIEEREKVLSGLQPAQVVLVSYGLLQQEETARLLARTDWNVVVLDEAQHIKNYRTKRARHALKLKARFRLATTGTPIENRLEELWTIFRFLQPGLLGSLEDFRRRFVLPIEKSDDGEARRRLKRLLRPFILRRLKTEVLKELPPRTETVLRLKFSPQERELYENLRLQALRSLENVSENPAARLEVLTQLLRLRQTCCSPRLIDSSLSIPETKLSALVDLLEEILSGGHKVLIFSQFVKYLHLIEEALSRKGIPYFLLEGSLSARKREELVRRFQQEEAPVFLLSLKAGGVGLNLTAADYVILTDPWWNPAVEDQAADRAHRIGQSRPVTVYRLVIKDTVEEKVIELHQKKRKLGEEILSDTGTPSLSLEELKNLLL